MTDDLTRFLAKPEALTPAAVQAIEPTSYINVTERKLDGEIVTAGNIPVNEGTARLFLEKENLNPDEWECTHFRRIEYGQGMTSVKFSYKRVAYLDPNRVPIDELISRVDLRPGVVPFARPANAQGFFALMSDNQLGKVDGDGTAGSLDRTLRYIDEARKELDAQRQIRPIGPVVLAGMGDHIEGFVSQGGANAWRTGLTLMEQTRLLRRIWLHFIDSFIDAADVLYSIAVPGNHGDTVRFQGKGVTAYDDSHDTEALLAVADATALNPARYGHVKFLVPRTDEVAIALDVADTRLTFAHGHYHAPGKHWTWIDEQSVDEGPLQGSNIHFEGHGHHSVIEERGRRTYVMAPATESESTWFKHRRGVRGNPGMMTGVFGDKRLVSTRIIR